MDSKQKAPDPAVEPQKAQADDARSAMGDLADAAEIAKKAHLDFLTSIILLIVSVATIITSIGYWQKQRCVFYQSAGFMPTVIAAMLGIMAYRLMRESLQNDSVKGMVARLGASFKATVRSERVHKAFFGLVMLAVYVYVLLGRLPFWLASFISLAAVLEYVHFDRTWKTAGKMLIIAALAVAAIVALFQYAFSVPMP